MINKDKKINSIYDNLLLKQQQNESLFEQDSSLINKQSGQLLKLEQQSSIKEEHYNPTKIISKKIYDYCEDCFKNNCYLVKKDHLMHYQLLENGRISWICGKTAKTKYQKIIKLFHKGQKRQRLRKLKQQQKTQYLQSSINQHSTIGLKTQQQSPSSQSKYIQVENLKNILFNNQTSKKSVKQQKQSAKEIENISQFQTSSIPAPQRILNGNSNYPIHPNIPYNYQQKPIPQFRRSLSYNPSYKHNAKIQIEAVIKVEGELHYIVRQQNQLFIEPKIFMNNFYSKELLQFYQKREESK